MNLETYTRIRERLGQECQLEIDPEGFADFIELIYIPMDDVMGLETNSVSVYFPEQGVLLLAKPVVYVRGTVGFEITEVDKGYDGFQGE